MQCVFLCLGSFGSILMFLCNTNHKHLAWCIFTEWIYTPVTSTQFPSIFRSPGPMSLPARASSHWQWTAVCLWMLLRLCLSFMSVESGETQPWCGVKLYSSHWWLLLYGTNMPNTMHVLHSTSHTEGQPHCFPGAIVYGAVMNTLRCVSLCWECVHTRVALCSFRTHCHTVSKVAVATFPPASHLLRLSVAPHSYQHLILCMYFIFAFPVGVLCCQVVLLIYLHFSDG